MEKELIKLEGILEKNIPTIVDALDKAEPITKEYKELIENFNSTMVVYSQLQEMFMRAAMASQKEEQVKEEK